MKTGISYFGNRNPRHFIIDLEEMVSHNCNFVVHTYTENDQLFYKNSMQSFVELSKNADLEVYVLPWGLGRVFGGEAFSNYALTNYAANQKLESGETAPAACPNDPQFVDFMMKWTDEAALMGADVICWKDPHFFSKYLKNAEKMTSCFCENCRTKYRLFYGEKFPVSVNDNLHTFREDSMIDFLATLCAYAKTKGLRNCVSLSPQGVDLTGIRDWEKLARIPELDILGTDPYWIYLNQDLKFVASTVDKVMQISQKYEIEPLLWIQNFKVPEDREHEIPEVIAASFAEGMRCFAAWSFYGTEYMSYIQCDNAKRVWDTLGEVYQKLQSGAWE